MCKESKNDLDPNKKYKMLCVGTPKVVMFSIIPYTGEDVVVPIEQDMLDFIVPYEFVRIEVSDLDPVTRELSNKKKIEHKVLEKDGREVMEFWLNRVLLAEAKIEGEKVIKTA